jgi:hypothetical protein
MDGGFTLDPALLLHNSLGSEPQAGGKILDLIRPRIFFHMWTYSSAVEPNGFLYKPHSSVVCGYTEIEPVFEN